MAIKVLVVGDNAAIKQHLLHLVETTEQYQFECVTTAEAAIELLARAAFEILITDVVASGQSGLDLLAACRRQQPELDTILLTEPGAPDPAHNELKREATAVLAKPVSLAILSETLRASAQRAAGRSCAPLSSRDASLRLVAQSRQMRKLLGQSTAIAPFNTTVLVTGESGTGKELIARTIHEHSPRRRRPFVALNCAAIPDQLLEDELFGHVKGAFSGAQTARAGRFEYANGGTLLLDEIGAMSLPLQAKLLRVLQEREFEKLGSSRSVSVDVRIIAATSADLEQKIKEGSFRLDLFYRLNVVHLRLAPLRERPEDIRPLATQLLAQFCASAGLPPKQIDAEVMRVLQAHPWPGNVRQLQNAMECAAALSGAAPAIYVWDLPEEVQGSGASTVTAGLGIEAVLLSQQSLPVEGLSLDAVVTNIERELLLRSLSQTGGNKMQAAKLLKMKRTTFVEKLKRLQIEELSEVLVAGLAAKPNGAVTQGGFVSVAESRLRC